MTDVRRRTARLHRVGLARAGHGSCRRTGSAGRRAPRSTSRSPRRPPAGGEAPARVHDPTGHAVRGHVHGPRARTPAGRRADPSDPAGGGRGVRRPGPPPDRDRAPVDRSREDRASPSGPMPSTPSTASGSRSSSPTTCWPVTERARSWPFPPTTNATSRSPSGSACRSGASSPSRALPPMPPMDDAFISHAADERLVNSGDSMARPRTRAAGDRRRAGRERRGRSPRSPTGCATG